MKLLIFTDLHLDKMALKELKSKSIKADLTLCAGDLTRFGKDLEEMIELLSDFKSEVLLVPGNNESLTITERLCIEQDNITFIHGKVVKRDVFNFAGLGGGLITDEAFYASFQLSEAEINKLLNNFRGLSDLVLLSHTPPLGLMGEVSPDNNIGSESILGFIEEEQPLLCVCGHAHEHAGDELIINKTRVINPGKHGKLIKL